MGSRLVFPEGGGERFVDGRRLVTKTGCGRGRLGGEAGGLGDALWLVWLGVRSSGLVCDGWVGLAWRAWWRGSILGRVRGQAVSS